MKKYHIGYAPGVYDLFHAGHLNLLKKAKELCDYLIVGVLTDEIVEYYKGKKPIIPLKERKEILESIRCVDEVVIVDFHNTDKLEAWNLYRYDCHFSGDDHAIEWRPLKQKLNELGSDMVFFDYTKGVSSTELKSKMKYE